jgi:hypothetical protein
MWRPPNNLKCELLQLFFLLLGHLPSRIRVLGPESELDPDSGSGSGFGSISLVGYRPGPEPGPDLDLDKKPCLQIFPLFEGSFMGARIRIRTHVLVLRLGPDPLALYGSDLAPGWGRVRICTWIRI